MTTLEADRDITPSDLSLSVPITTGLQAAVDFATLMVTGMGCWVLSLAWKRPDDWDRYLYASMIIGLVAVVFASFSRLYAFDVISRADAHRLPLAVPIIKSFLTFLLLTFSFGHADLAYSRGWVFLYFIASETTFLIQRTVMSRLMYSLARQGRLARNLVVVGSGQSAEMLVRVLTTHETPWVRILGSFDDRRVRCSPIGADYPVLGDTEQLVAFSRHTRIDDIFICLPWNAEARLNQLYARLRNIPANFHLIPEISADWMARASFIPYFGVTVLKIGGKPIDDWNYVVKWVEDKALAMAMIVALAPVLLLAAVAVRLDSRGPILFRQNRLGFNNNLIQIYKFRTMYHESRDENAEQLTTRGDPRVTRVGRILRRYSIDELPQLFNVLKGEMSLVGPRPHALSAKAAGRPYVEVVENYAERHKIKPGITGLAQVNGWRGETDTEEKITNRIHDDMYYMENWSLLFDIKIMVRTLYTIFSTESAY